MLYTMYEMGLAALTPARAAAAATRQVYTSPFNPASYSLAGRSVAAAAEVFRSVTRRYQKPEWNLPTTKVEGTEVAVTPRTVWSTTWADLIHFQREPHQLRRARGMDMDPKLLIVAPMSGHYATLLRGTVEAFLPDHEVYCTDWRDARLVPISEGRFGLDDYIDHVRDMLRFLGPQSHVLAVCQPGPATIAAVSLMAEDGDPATPSSMTLMGSPIDTRLSPTEPNRLAEDRPLDWFRNHVVHTVPWPHPGFLRRVYPGFVQLAGFMNMNWDRHVDAHWSFFEHLVAGDGDSADRHREFYDEYLSVMDLTAEFYLETIERVFQKHLLPRGRLLHRGRLVKPSAITRTGLLTVEGEHDDISGIGQTQAAHDLCTALPDSRKLDYVQPGVGHYGVFNGRRFRSEVRPKVAKFIRANWDVAADKKTRAAPLGAGR
ncbi:MAG: polyhydroxyalkanoate depolymerase [Caulobacterales bacterium]|nr:polyhydroxyalkanoate depolymerase [Caulobacterales bacterium]